MVDVPDCSLLLVGCDYRGIRDILSVLGGTADYVCLTCCEVCSRHDHVFPWHDFSHLHDFWGGSENL